MGLSGNILVYLIIQNLRFYYIFDTRRNYGFNIQNLRKISLLGFPINYNDCWKKILGISRSVPTGPLFSKYD